jgi:uncharacterized membrane protein YhdT|tara:strand:+ start:170 stop:400 length:231 start_codon:yes stop_codon:yes gene_type:complete
MLSLMVWFWLGMTAFWILLLPVLFAALWAIRGFGVAASQTLTSAPLWLPLSRFPVPGLVLVLFRSFRLRDFLGVWL